MIKLWLALPVAIFFFAADTAISQDMRLGESCNLSIAGAPDKESFLAFDRELRYALSKQDPMVMSLLVGFPLRVNDGAGSILVNDATALQARFEDVFPPKIRSAVLDHKVESVSCNFGGIMYGNGDLWVYVTEQGYEVAAINLPRSQRKVPVLPKLDFVCDAEKHRVVVDALPGRAYRYRAWDKPRSITERPDVEVSTGTKEYQGTGPCRHPIWTFADGDSEMVVSGLGCSAASNQPPAGARGTLDVSVTKEENGHWWCY